jgi:hypothetical protein
MKLSEQHKTDVKEYAQGCGLGLVLLAVLVAIIAAIASFSYFVIGPVNGGTDPVGPANGGNCVPNITC